MTKTSRSSALVPLVLALAAWSAPRAQAPARPRGASPALPRSALPSRLGLPSRPARAEARSASSPRRPAGRAASSASSASPGGAFAEAQPQHVGWTRDLDVLSGAHDYAYALATGPGGAVYVCGEVEVGPGDDDVFLAKLDRRGELVWVRTYDGSAGSYDLGWHVVVSPQGTVLVEADTTELQSGTDMTVLAYDPAGNLLWARSYDGPAHGYDAFQGGVALAADAAGNAVCAGTSWNGTDYDMVALKYAPDGTPLWEYRYDNGGYDDGFGVVLDAAGDAYVVGDTTMAGPRDFLTIKFLPDGTVGWLQSWDSPFGGAELVFAVNLDGLGNVLVTGTSEDGVSDNDFSTVTYDPSGALRWYRQYGVGNHGIDTPYWIVGDASGDVAVAGFSQPDPLATSAAAVFYDVAGNELWSDIYAPTYEKGENSFNDLEFDAAGNLVALGPVYYGVADAYDSQLVVYSPAGQRLREERLDLGQHGVEIPINLFQDPATGTIYATGYGLGPGGTVDSFVARLSDAFGYAPLR